MCTLSYTLSHIDALRCIHYLIHETSHTLSWQHEHASLCAFDTDQKTVCTLRLPLSFPRPKRLESGVHNGIFHPVAFTEEPKNYVQRISQELPSIVLILMQAGQAALGFFEESEVVHHKVIRKYMVRKKQGKSQLKHLRTKGKSRAGSRIRLNETIAFAEEINQTLTRWDILDHTDFILYSSSIELWNLLFQSKVSSAFTRNDPRLRSLSLYSSVPKYDELLRVHASLQTGQLSIHQHDKINFHR